MQWNPQTNRFDIPAGNAPEKEEMAGKTITTDQGIMQWNPATKSYDIKAGDAPEKEAAEKTLQDSDGVWYKVGHDNTAVPITLNGQPFKGKMPAAAGDDFAQFYQKYLKEKGLPDNSTNEKKARTEWAASSQQPERPPVVLIPGPNNTVVPTQARIGVPLSNDFQTVSGAGGANAKAAEGQANVKAALDYATSYLKSGAYTGAGDEALMEKYFELAKPSSGFRMSQPQIDMLMKGRSWMGSAEGIAYHAKTGQWFPPQQRQEIVDTMANLGAAKGVKSEQGGNGGGGGIPKEGETYQGGKVLKVTKIK
jgi:hypothetical protein